MLNSGFYMITQIGHIAYRIGGYGATAIYAAFVLCFAISFALPGMASDKPEKTVTRLYYAVNDSETGEKKGEVYIRITRGAELNEWHEVRIYEEEEETETFDVTFEPDTLRPTSYKRRIKDPEGVRTIKVQLDGRLLKATITDPGGKISKQRLTLPKGTVIIEPFMKYYLTQVVDASQASGEFNAVGLLGDEMKVFPADWEVTGNETIDVPAGRFECINIRVSSSSWYLKLFDTSTPVWLDVSGAHHIIRTTVRKSLFAGEMPMVLTRIAHGPISQPPDGSE